MKRYVNRRTGIYAIPVLCIIRTSDIHIVNTVKNGQTMRCPGDWKRRAASDTMRINRVSLHSPASIADSTSLSRPPYHVTLLQRRPRLVSLPGLKPSLPLTSNMH